MPLSTHVLDISRGAPVAGIEVTLTAAGAAQEIARSVTDSDGRIAAPFGGALESGAYELRFFVRPYFERLSHPTLYDEVPVRFVIDDGSAHYHLPLLLSPWGYSTYRGS
jgi:5-hydroxyisourate hydrolase